MDKLVDQIKMLVFTSAWTIYLANMFMLNSEAVSTEMKVVFLTIGMVFGVAAFLEFIFERAFMLAVMTGGFTVVQVIMLYNLLH